MAQVAISIGSNENPWAYICAGLDSLAHHFKDLKLSSVYESEAIGFQGDNFLNLVATFTTLESITPLANILRNIERDHGLLPQQEKFSKRKLDIDILTYDDLQGDFDGTLLPRPEITQNAYVLWPMAELLGDQICPGCESTFAQLWQAYDKNKQKLWPINFKWRGKPISRAG